MSDTTLSPVAESTQSTVDPRERVVFFRSWGFFDPAEETWQLSIRGRISAPLLRRRIHKRVLLRLFERVIRPGREEFGKQRFLDRAHLFLQESSPGRSVPIAIAERAIPLPECFPNGHFESFVRFPEEGLADFVQVDGDGRRFLSFCACLSEDDHRLFSGEIELIPQEGISVISDVDDTIKVTNVRDRRELLANTFTREFRAVEGMAEVYRKWATAGVSFHYVSASPWPLYSPLVDWLDEDGFPRGTVHLRHVRLRDLRRERARADASRGKRMAIEELLRAYPRRRFILCGDSSERDAELYGEIARTFGDQILLVAIRDCTTDGPDRCEEVRRCLEPIHGLRWKIFRSANELASVPLP